jgi:hypothetical protein
LRNQLKGKTTTLLIAEIVNDPLKDSTKTNRSNLKAVAKQRYSVRIETLHFSQEDLENFVALDSEGNKLKTEVIQTSNSDIVGM